MCTTGGTDLQGREHRKPYQHRCGKALRAARRRAGHEAQQRGGDISGRDAEEVLRLAAETQ